MRVLVQRSKNSSVTVDGKMISSINRGLVLLVGFTYGDSLADIKKLAKKIVNLRIFDDDAGVMNRSILDVGGEILSISQFTLYANTSKGNRPSYIDALNGEEAILLYEKFNQILNQYVVAKPGVFGADMKVNILNDGPVTILLES